MKDEPKSLVCLGAGAVTASASAPPYKILAELTVPGASMFSCRESFVLLRSCAGFRRPPGLPWQQFLLKYR